MTIRQFGPWMPDQPNLGNPCITATNVIAQAKGYGPFPAAAIVTDALPAGCVGAISLKQVDGTKETFAGTTTKLYRLSGTSWTDVSRTSGGAYSTGTYWRFTIYGKRLVATNGIDNPQGFDLGTDTDFADIPNAPIAAFFIVIRDVLVALAVNDGSIFQIKFSAVNDSEKWTADCGGGSQQVPDGGPVIGGTGGEFGVVLQEYGLTRMDFVGGDLRFTFDKIEGAIGCIAADSIAEYKGRTFYLSEEGFQLFNGAESQNISDELISNFFFDDVTTASLATVRAAVDPANSMVVWVYPTSAGNKMLVYRYRLQQWSYVDLTTLVGDCPLAYIGATQILAGFDGNDKLFTYSGAAMSSAILSTGDLTLFERRNATITAARGLVDSAHQIRIGRKRDFAASETVVIATAASNGKASLRANGKYHRLELRPTAAWTEATGIDIEVVPSGRRS